MTASVLLYRPTRRRAALAAVAALGSLAFAGQARAQGSRRRGLRGDWQVYRKQADAAWQAPLDKR